MKLTYHRSGDYLLPNLAVPDAPISLGKYGRMHAAYLKEHKPILYIISHLHLLAATSPHF